MVLLLQVRNVPISCPFMILFLWHATSSHQLTSQLPTIKRCSWFLLVTLWIADCLKWKTEIRHYSPLQWKFRIYPFNYCLKDIRFTEELLSEKDKNKTKNIKSTKKTNTHTFVWECKWHKDQEQQTREQNIPLPGQTHHSPPRKHGFGSL